MNKIPIVRESRLVNSLSPPNCTISRLSQELTPADRGLSNGGRHATQIMRAFALTVFSGAFLLFQVQPLMGKFILPWFGGSPAVWTTCLLFFQLLLLAGYLYAHVSARYFKPRQQALVHLVLLASALAFLPIIPAEHWKPDPDENPAWRILAILTVCLGLPYAVLSATGPLMQEWFSRLNPGQSPYRLYALSNAGSLLALVSYPLLVEPNFTRKAQAVVWSCGLGVFAVLGAICAIRLWRTNPKPPVSTADAADGHTVSEPPTATQKALWLVLPACASVLLLSTTNKMCQDIAVVPFLWVLPLGLYLLSFVICFDNPVWYFRRLFHLAAIPILGLLCLALFEGRDFPLALQIGIYSAALFVCCMVCHGELFRLKPHPRFLTSYYLGISGGGALGGVFVAVVAPLIFNSHLELHVGLIVFSLLLVAIYVLEHNVVTIEGRRFTTWKWASAVALGLALALSAQVLYAARHTLSTSRNFFGVLRVLEYHQESAARHMYVLASGEITHGMQFADRVLAGQPTTYFHERSGVGLAILNFPQPSNRRMGVVGLGAGTLAAYGREGDSIRFYEINPEVKRLAETRFTYLADSKARVEVVLGDARLSMEREEPQQFDLLVLDAFSGDAIPVHLLTREAWEIYLRHLKPDGVIAAHITNRHLDLYPVVKNLADRFQFRSVLISNHRDRNRPIQMPSDWVLLTRREDFLDRDEIRAVRSEPRHSRSQIPLWTDDHASLLKILY